MPAIHRVLDLAKTAPQEAVTDEVSLLLAIKVGLAIKEFKGPRKYQYSGPCQEKY